MKKILFLIIVIIFVFSINSYAENTEEDSILLSKILYDISKDDYFTRKSFLISIMRVAGMTDEQAEEYYYVSYFAPVFQDVEYRDKYDGYILHAYSNGIAKGYEAEKDEDELYYINEEGLKIIPRYFFCPDNIITVNEAILFATRITNVKYDCYNCLLQEKYQADGISENLLLYEDGYLILKNMLKSKRYLYFNNTHLPNKEIDKNGEVTYLQHLNRG